MNEILQAIPHRPPFLFLDKIIEVTDSSLKAVKKISKSEPFFQGHYPDFPVTPGVLLCESIFQAAAVLISKTEDLAADVVPVLTRISGAKFKQMVFPDDTIEIQAILLEKVSNAFFFKGTVRVHGKLAVRIEFACSSAKKGAMQ